MAKKKTVVQVPVEDVKVERYKASLKVELTPAEIADRADRAAHLLKDRDQKEADMKAAQKHAKSIIEEIEAELRRLSNEVRTKSTYASIECERRYDYGQRTYREVRTDTWETLAQRPLTESEMQRELAFAEAEEE